ncbi:alpha/beta hydrolase [Radiobacillus sp. PE A8.2]|uniref:alpha/beta hydrolase n=1 Tax=Radiobacillus sp. PE A8.2 TaxID=3380349 RepID=UPI0038907CA1
MIGCLCLHGFTGGPYELSPMTDYFRKRTDWQVVAPSLPGHGNELTLERTTYKNWIEVAENALKKLIEQCDKIYIIGFSMGGMIASYLAARYNVNKLVLLSTARKYLNVRQLTVDMLRFGKEALAGELAEDKVFQRYNAKKGKIPIRALVEFQRCVRFTKPFLKQLECPVLIAQGLQDGIVPYKSAYALKQEIPVDSEVIFFHDSKHHICFSDERDALIQSVYSFLTRDQDIEK